MEPRPALLQPELLPLPDGVASDRVFVRRYQPGDGAAFFAALALHREELMQWLAWPQLHQRPDDSAGEFLGGSGFHAPHWKTPRAEIGYFLLPPARGQGFASEVVRLLVHYAFERMQLNRVSSTCDANNSASANVLRRSGLIEEGRMRAETRDHHGQLRDTLIFGLTIGDFAHWLDQHAVSSIKYI